MRSTLIICCLLIFGALLPAADEPRQLDPAKPAEAILIIDGLTRQLNLPRDHAIALTMAIQTVGKLVAADAEAKAKAAEPKPVEPAKPKE